MEEWKQNTLEDLKMINRTGKEILYILTDQNTLDSYKDGKRHGEGTLTYC